MFYVLKLLIKLIGSFVYDKPQEGEFNNRSFNPKKFSIFILILSLILYSTTISLRVYRLAIETRQLRLNKIYYICKYTQKCDNISPELYKKLDKDLSDSK